MKSAETIFKDLNKKFSTPRQVQNFLHRFEYNRETDGDTLRSALSALKKRQAHCLEAAFLAAAILEHSGYEPLVMSLESIDNLDHVIFIFKEARGWGAIGRSRMPGLHGRAPIFRSLRDLAYSYFDPFIDATGRITGYGVAHLDAPGADWRTSRQNVWSLEKYLIDLPHKALKGSEARFQRGYRHYKATGQSGWPQRFWW